MAFAVQAARADHGGAHVGIVDTQTDQDLGLVPLELTNIGDTREIDLYVRVPNALVDDVYAGEFHLSIEPRGVIRVRDSQAEFPGINPALDGEGLALTPLERLRLTVTTAVRAIYRRLERGPGTLEPGPLLLPGVVVGQARPSTGSG